MSSSSESGSWRRCSVVAVAEAAEVVGTIILIDLNSI
jgi:hypothetical protein